MRCYAAHRDRLLVFDGVEDPGESGDAAGGALHVADRRVALADYRPECVAAHPAAPDRAFVGTFESGLHVTRDGGETFERDGEGIDQDAITAVAVDPADPERVFVGTEPSRCYRSTDAGRSFDRVEGLTDVPSAPEWSFPPRPDTHHVRWIAPDPNDGDRLYVGVEAGALVYTTDGGETWHDRPPGSRRDNHQLATHADAPGRVYSAAGDGYAESTDGVRASEASAGSSDERSESDGAESWTTRHDGLEHTYVWSVLPDPGDPDRVLVTAARGPGSAHSVPGESYLYRRDAADDTWTRLDGPLSGSGRLRAVLAGDGTPGRAWATNDQGCYASADFGDTWARLDVEWPEELEGHTARGLAVVPEPEA